MPIALRISKAGIAMVVAMSLYDVGVAIANVSA
jgi:hypothetical protein